jgi:long-chain acyl-CoA synthetase
MTPFDASGTTRGPDGVLRYDVLPVSLVGSLAVQAERVPDEEAVVEVGGERLTYAQLWDRAARVAGGLRAAGVGRGDRVAVRLPNGVPWVLGFLGTVLAGALAVPVNTRFTDEEVAHVVGDSGARLVLDSPDLPTGAPYADEGLGHDDLAALFYTSGTTGAPKGACLTHGGLLSIGESTKRIRHVGDGVGQRNLVSVPLFHVTGCNSQFLSMLQVGGTAVVLPRFTVPSFLEALESERITMSTSVPAIYWLALQSPDFARRDLSHLAQLSYGGAPIAPELVARLRAAVPGARLGNGYGLSEAASVVTYLPHEWADRRPESVGFPIPVDDVRVDADGAETGVAGQLLVRGPNIAAGYWGMPEQTARTFVDGWLRTGDIAAIDDEGLVTVLDRAKDMVCRGGENVYSLEVENVLAAHPSVGEVAVVGVADEVMGEKVGAVLVRAPGRSLDVDRVLDHAREHLADFKVPEYVAVRSEPLPRNPGGKVLKPALREGTSWTAVPRRKR